MILAVTSKSVRAAVPPTMPAKVTVPACAPLPAVRVRDRGVRLLELFTVLLNIILPPFAPVVLMLAAPVASRTGLLKVIAAPFPATPIPPPAVPPDALIVLLFRVTAELPVELRVMVPASPPSKLVVVLVPPEVLMLPNPMVPVVVERARSPPIPPSPLVADPPRVLTAPVTETFPVVALMAISPPAPPFSPPATNALVPAPPVAVTAPETVTVPVAPVIITFPPALPAPALLAAPVVVMAPARLIVPAPVAVTATAPEAVPAAAVVRIVCPAAKSTPPTPPVKVTAPPAVVIPAFRSKVAPCRVTLVVAPVAPINPSTCTSPKVPLERIVTGSRNADVSTVTKAVCAA